jgi:putative transmembrane protein PGPGW
MWLAMEKLKAILDRPHEEVMRDLHHRRRQQRNRNPVARTLVVVGASVLALGGAVMTVLPGPKLPAVALGFYLLAFEFDWAERLVEWAMRKTEAAKQKYERAGPVKKYGGLVMAILAIGGFAVAFRLLLTSAG